MGAFRLRLARLSVYGSQFRQGVAAGWGLRGSLERLGVAWRGNAPSCCCDAFSSRAPLRQEVRKSSGVKP